MHPSEKRAVFIILNSLEQQIGQLKGLLAGSDAATPVSRGTAQATAALGGYLSDDEEAKLEAAMEGERAQLIKDNEGRVQAAWQQLNGEDTQMPGYAGG